MKTKRKRVPVRGARCTVLNCNNSVAKKLKLGLRMTFHKYPTNEEQRRKWIAVCQPRGGLGNLHNRYICSLHFEPHLIKAKNHPGGKTLLVTGAIPTLLLPEVPTTLLSSASDSQSETGSRYDEDIEKIVVSCTSDDDVEVEEVDLELTGTSELASASTSSAVDNFPSKSGTSDTNKPSWSNTSKLTISIEPSLEDSMDWRFSDEDSELEDAIDDLPHENFDFFDLEDSLEVGCSKTSKNLTKKVRRAICTRFFARLASLIPPHSRTSKLSVLQDAVSYLKELTKVHTVGAIEEEILMQKHYLLRKRKEKLESLVKRAKKMH